MRLDSSYSVEDANSTVQLGKTTVDLVTEVLVTRGVNQVDRPGGFAIFAVLLQGPRECDGGGLNCNTLGPL